MWPRDRLAGVEQLPPPLPLDEEESVRQENSVWSDTLANPWIQQRDCRSALKSLAAAWRFRVAASFACDRQI